jgi:glycine cleavage system H protein
MSNHYTASHEWIVIDGDVATVGSTDHAQALLGDLVFEQLPDVGKEVVKGAPAAVVESIKSAPEVFAPLSATMIESNASVCPDPALVDSVPVGAGWLFKLKISEPVEISTLLSKSGYEANIR